MQAGDLIGTNKILEKDELKTKEKHHGIYWKVECVLCGEVRSIRSDCLSYKCRTCAAKSRAFNKNTSITDNLIGQNFGYWTVIDKAEKPNYWHCKCKCGTEKDVFRGNLTQGLSKSCGCVSSWGETQIIYLLQQNNILYQKEYTFDDLKTEKGGTPRFDFAIFNKKHELKYLLEYDGRQHKYYDKNWKMSSEDFITLQKNDLLKEEYCKKNNILLLRINDNSNLEQIINSIKIE